MSGTPVTDARPSWLARFRAHRVARNAGALGFVQVLTYGSAFVVLVHLTRVLGVETYGVVAFSIGITQVLSVVLDLGFAMSATQRIAVLRDDRDAVARITGAVLVLKLGAFLMGAVGLVAYALLTEKYAPHAMLFVLSALPLLGHSLQPFWFFVGIERMKSVTLFFMVARLSYVAFVLLFVRAESDYLWVPLADGIGQLAAAATGILLIGRAGYRVARPSRADVAEAWRSTTGFFLSRIASTAQSGSGVILLGLATAPATVAIYAFAEQLYRGMHAAFAPVTHALYPYMAKERDLSLLARVTVAFAALALAGGVAGHFIAAVAVPAVLGPEWRAALPVLDVFLLAIVVHAVVLLAGYPLAAALGRLETANRSMTIGAVLHLALAGVLLVSGHATPLAFAWVMVVSELYMLVHCGVALVPAARRQHAAAR